MYLLKRCVIILFLYFPLFIFSQDKLEVIMPWFVGQDSSAGGLYAVEDDFGDYFILCYIKNFYPGLGFPFHGYKTYGTGMIKINPFGDMVWKKLYPTYCTWSGDACTLTPAWNFIVNSNGEIVFPYYYFPGYIICDPDYPNIGFPNYYRGIFNVSQIDGEILHHVVTTGPTPCAREKVTGIKETNEGYILLSYHSNYYQNPSCKNVHDTQYQCMATMLLHPDKFDIHLQMT